MVSRTILQDGRNDLSLRSKYLSEWAIETRCVVHVCGIVYSRVDHWFNWVLTCSIRPHSGRLVNVPQGCGQKVTLAAGDAVRCNMCGSRILWKLRTKKVVQYEARNRCEHSQEGTQ